MLERANSGDWLKHTTRHMDMSQEWGAHALICFFFCQEPPPKLNGSLGVSEDGAKTTLCAEF